MYNNESVDNIVCATKNMFELIAANEIRIQSDSTLKLLVVNHLIEFFKNITELKNLDSDSIPNIIDISNKLIQMNITTNLATW
jgi:hypothetical protein